MSIRLIHAFLDAHCQEDDNPPCKYLMLPGTTIVLPCYNKRLLCYIITGRIIEVSSDAKSCIPTKGKPSQILVRLASILKIANTHTQFYVRSSHNQVLRGPGFSSTPLKHPTSQKCLMLHQNIDSLSYLQRWY
jgi:hypothetical protein